MTLKKETRSILYSDPFQLQMPTTLGLSGSTPDGFYTFRLQLSLGAGGIQGYMPLYSEDYSKVTSGEPPWNWIDCFGLTQIPGLRPGAQFEDTFELRLYFKGVSFDCQHSNSGAIACWDETNPTCQKLWEAWIVPDDGFLPEAETIVKNLLSEVFTLRKITEPTIQVPHYQIEHRETLFGCGPTFDGGV